MEVEVEAPGALADRSGPSQSSRRSTSRRSCCLHGRPLALEACDDLGEVAGRSGHGMSGVDESRSYIGTSTGMAASDDPGPRTGRPASGSTSAAALQSEARLAASGRLGGPKQRFRRSGGRLRRRLRTGRQPSTGGTICGVSDACNLGWERTSTRLRRNATSICTKLDELAQTGCQTNERRPKAEARKDRCGRWSGTRSEQKGRRPFSRPGRGTRTYGDAQFSVFKASGAPDGIRCAQDDATALGSLAARVRR